MPSRPDHHAPQEAEHVVDGAPPSEALSIPLSAEHAELQRQGAKAAARGEAQDSNPLLDAINQPDATGESERVWSDRRDAWDRGHDSQQRPTVSPARIAGGTAPIEHAQDEVLFGVTRVLTFDGRKGLTSASGFFFERDLRLFLVTSGHVFFDAATGHAPDRVEIELHTDSRDLTQLVTLSILLHRDGLSAWSQARDSAGEVDVAALEIDRTAMPADCVVRPFGPPHLPAGFDLFEVGDRLAIPGFPLGFFDTVHHLPVIRQASVASSYGVRFQGRGYFLTDARMHRGCSGSPVLARASTVAPGRVRWYLVGVHSSRMDMVTRNTVLDESLGLNCAWYADVLIPLTAGSSRELP
ncbi:trypsin-like peptidase domain-containing protein [Mitsuaria sp. TWR114]|uniref:trypsin-like serine peptidase n=1 Tax=Mitsuaria sp. TWR114 TaxID=2601731 RepID=UPI0011BD7FA4|nr:serine protease [Mitsuaria sp. TWR114]TXD92566.1 trypsin-like peptidase domain-containing protein [Mitsuaria sp. TWR114]